MIHVHCLHVGMLPIEQQHEVGGEEDSQSTTRMPMHTPTQISIRMRATWANLLISNQESLVQQVQTHTHTQVLSAANIFYVAHINKDKRRHTLSPESLCNFVEKTTLFEVHTHAKTQ